MTGRVSGVFFGFCSAVSAFAFAAVASFCLPQSALGADFSNEAENLAAAMDWDAPASLSAAGYAAAKKAADAGDVAAWVALGDDAMVQGKGVGAALRAYRKAQKLCASTPDVAYMPQVCLRVAQYETQYISRKQALAQLAEAKQGFLIRQKEGDETARSWLDETERVIRQLLENESG